MYLKNKNKDQQVTILRANMFLMKITKLHQLKITFV